MDLARAGAHLSMEPGAGRLPGQPQPEPHQSESSHSHERSPPPHAATTPGGALPNGVVALRQREQPAAHQDPTHDLHGYDYSTGSMNPVKKRCWEPAWRPR